MTNVPQPYQQYISIDSEIRFGRPCITGTRISVYDVLGWLGLGMSPAEIIDDFPELTEEQIRACLLYAADRERKIRVVA
ncbi:DUF433 domain-containing protein [Fibrella sp. WM1]|uniref:DUF433 domain-containing protein n=1 Tax=Fibrella musci TaxID=3242485 RepID=UPI003522E8F9